MTSKELYLELQKPQYDSRPYSRMDEWGDNMEIVTEVIDDYWRQRFLINHADKTAYKLMDSDLTLKFIGEQDVDWEGVKKTIRTPIPIQPTISVSPSNILNRELHW